MAIHFEQARREYVSISMKLLIQWTAYHIALMKVGLSYIPVNGKQFNYKEGLTKDQNLFSKMIKEKEVKMIK